MKTLADLKRDLKVGDTITLVESKISKNNVGVKRFVIKKQSNGVTLAPNKDDKRGSFLEFVNAKLTEYDGDEIRIYNPGERDLTEQERYVFDNKPSSLPENREMIEIDARTDMDRCWYKDKAWFNKYGMEYLLVGTATKRYNHATGKVVDGQVKGDIVLRYKIGLA